MLRKQLAALTLAAVTFATAGCGGSSKTGTDTQTAAATAATGSSSSAPAAGTTTLAKLATGRPLTRTALIATADKICARTNAKTHALQTESIAGIARTFPQVALYHRNEAIELAALVPPPSMARDWELIVHDLQLHSQYLNEVARAIDRKDQHAATHPFEHANTVINEVIETARRAGFAHCSKLS
jgi:hypothetical protein